MYKIEVDNKSWTIRELLEMYRTNVLSMDIPVQRGLVWDNGARSLYIHSALLGILAVQPPFVFSRHISHREDASACSSYSVLDGKQRLSTIIAFIDDEFKLSGLQDQPYIDDMDLTGLKYTALPANLIQQILDTSVTCTVVTDPTAEQEDIIFARLNNNKSMSAIDKIRPQCKATVSIIDFINSNSGIFRAMFSEKQLVKKPEFEIVLKMLAMLSGEAGLSSTQVSKFAKQLTSNPDLTDLQFVSDRAVKLDNQLAIKFPEVPSFLKNKAVFLAFVPYLNKRDLADDTLIDCIFKVMTERLAEFKTGSAHSPTAATVLARKDIIDSCL